MEWLVPHIARINNFCSTLENGQKSYLHISGKFPNAEQVCSCGIDITTDSPYSHRHYSTCNMRQDDMNDDVPNRREENYDSDRHASSIADKRNVDVDIKEYPPNNNIDFQGQLRRYHEIMKAKAKTLPVSVIVSDRTNSMSSSTPSPTSSVTDSMSHDDRQGPDGDKNSKANAKNKIYMYKPAPMVRKSERRFISAEKKDNTYWERRKRNNEAAKKSRESRREKEIEVNRKADLLKSENEAMRFTILNLQERNAQLENSTKIYKEILIKNNLI